jgi:hypothetical protein
MRKLALLVLLIPTFGITACQPKQEIQASEQIVKQSSSAICHDANSGSFKRTKNYTPTVCRVALMPVESLTRALKVI